MRHRRWGFGFLVLLLSCDRVVNDARLTQAVTIRVNLSSAGAEAILSSLVVITSTSVTSKNGRYVAFVSNAANLHPDDIDSIEDVFVRDVETGTTILASRADGVNGQKANADCLEISISADGLYVVFATSANLAGDDTDGQPSVYVRNIQQGATRLLSRAQGGGAGQGREPSISGNGRFVAFASVSALISTDDTIMDIYAVDVFDAFNNIITLSLITEDVSGICSQPSISEDGTSIAYRREPAPDQINLRRSWNGASPSTILISQSSGGTPGNGLSQRPSVSGDARLVAFSSQATLLVSGDTNGKEDIFVRDITNATTALVSLNDRGLQSVDNCSLTLSGRAISSDGRFVVFDTQAGNLVPDDTNGVRDIFVRDLTLNTTRRVSVATYGDQAIGSASDAGSISSDGAYVVFVSNASTLVERDTNGQQDYFRRGPLR